MSRCGCGCGRETPLAKNTDKRRGLVRGEPTRFLRGHQRRKSPIAFRVDPDSGCWNWQRVCFDTGYPAIQIKGRTRRAHRVYYERLIGPIPEGCEVHHVCENKRCVNPRHLRPLEHDAHAAISPLSKSGSRNPNAKLTEGDVREIRRRAERGTRDRVLAADFDTTVQNIRHITTRRAWRHV